MNDAGYSLLISGNGGSIDVYDDSAVVLTASTGFGFDGEITTTNLYTLDGSSYNKTTIPERTITLKLTYIDQSSDVEADKLRVQKVFSPRQKLKIHYRSPNRNCYIYGWTEKCDTPENTYPLVTAVTIVCPDPYWTESSDQMVTVPFEDGSVTIYNPGDTNVGVLVEITPTSDLTWVRLEINGSGITSDNALSGGHSWVDPITKYEPGKIVTIDTRDRHKIIKYQGSDRFATTKVGELYPQLSPGYNTVELTSDGTFTATCSYEPKYGGI